MKAMEKEAIRKTVWRLLEERGVARFPRPAEGRIPNFVGAEKAAKLLKTSKSYESADVIKVNPDSPQRPVRETALMDGKTLVMPTPRIREGFLMVRGNSLSKYMAHHASSISGMYRVGRSVDIRAMPHVDLIVVGSVAVSRDGWRLGKGEGYAELEYAMLRDAGVVDGSTPVYTTVHDLQLVDEIPHTVHDLPVDTIFTNTSVIECPKQPKPTGIIWDMLDKSKISEIPPLALMYGRRRF
jgi:5-formyltetrahydrofolate cyclo-ligase